MAFFIAQVFYGVVQGEKLYALFFGVFRLFAAGGHFGFAATVDNHGAFGTQATGGTHRVHGGVATSDDGYMLTVEDGGCRHRSRQHA